MSNIDKYTNFISEQVQRESTVGLRTVPILSEVKIDAEGDSDHAIDVMGSALKKDGITIKNHGSIGDADRLTFHKNGKKIGEHHVDWKDKAVVTALGIHSQVKAHTNVKPQFSKSVKEAKDPHADMEDEGFMHFHTTPEGHHIYAHEDTGRGEELHYAVKHPDGKVTQHSIVHGVEPPTNKQLNSKQEWHDVSKHDIPHDGVRKAIHDDIKDQTS